MLRQIIGGRGRAMGRQIFGRCVKPHVDGHQAAADQIGLAGFLHANGHVGLAHGQVQQAFLKHQIDLEIGVFFVKRRQARGQPERPEPDGGRDPQFAKYLLLAVADARGGGIEALGHVLGRVKQQFALLGQDQTARMAVKQGRVQPFLQRADLAADGRLRQMQRIARMRQAARIGHGMKNP